MHASVDYVGYQAKAATASNRTLQWARAAYRVLKTGVLYNTLLYPYGLYKHRALLRSTPRCQGHTYTCFLRAPSQLDALVGPVMEYLRTPLAAGRRLEIQVFACSNGAEAYTIASILHKQLPQLDFHITASDLHQEMIDRGIAATYSVDEVFHSGHVTDEFVADTFDTVDLQYVVKPRLRDRVSFVRADLLGNDLHSRFGDADIVVAQNVLFHLSPGDATTAFANLCRQLKPRGVLMIEGMDHGLRVALTRMHRLRPLTFNCREIYNESRMHVDIAWWRYYYGAEPYSVFRTDRHRRFGSIFLQSPEPAA